jgi:hypothetical protein
LEKESEDEHVSIWYEGKEQTTTEDFMTNNDARPIRVNVCTSIEKFRGRLEAIQNDNGLAKGIQVHYVLWSFLS